MFDLGKDAPDFSDWKERWEDFLLSLVETQIEAKIIEPIHEATEWLHPILVVPKKGTNDMQMCIDLRRLNKSVKRTENPHKFPLGSCQNNPGPGRHNFLASFDAFKGYHQIELDKESRALTSFMTPVGCY
jgi:hypothetical protein